MGAAGGVGTTRLTVEVGAVMAAEGENVVLLDAALETQGLADHVIGPIDPDLSTVLIDANDHQAALSDHPADHTVVGRLQCLPVVAPFGRIAAAKAPEAAQRLTTVARTLAEDGKTVVVDVPPIASNTAVAGATAADRTILVTTDSARGREAIARSRGVLDDIGLETNAVVANRTDSAEMDDIDLAVPAVSRTETPRIPTALTDSAPFSRAIETVASSLFDVDLVTEPDRGPLASLRNVLPS